MQELSSSPEENQNKLQVVIFTVKNVAVLNGNEMKCVKLSLVEKATHFMQLCNFLSKKILDLRHSSNGMFKTPSAISFQP